MKKKRKILSPIAFILTFLLMFQSFTPVAFAEDSGVQGSQYEVSNSGDLGTEGTEGQNDGTDSSENGGAEGTGGENDGTEPSENGGAEGTNGKNDGTEPSENGGAEGTDGKNDGTEPSENGGADDVGSKGEETDGAEGLEKQEKDGKDILPTLGSIYSLDTLVTQDQAPKEKNDLMVIIQSTVKKGGETISEGEQITVNPGEEIEIEFEFKFPLIGEAEEDDTSGEPKKDTYVQTNDYMNIPIQGHFVLTNNVSVDAYYEGKVIGTAVFTANNIKFTFSEYVDELNEKDTSNSASATVSAKLKFNGTSSEEQDKTYEISILDKTFEVVVPKAEPKTVEIEKSKIGTIDSANKNRINWAVSVQAKYSDNSDASALSLEGYTFKDDLSNVGKFVPDSFYIQSGTEQKVKLSDPTDSTELTYAFTDQHKGVQYLFFQTEISNEKFISGGTVQNTAELTKDNESIEIPSNEITISQPTWITKKGEIVPDALPEGGYNHINRKIKWTIIANEAGLTISNAQITDTLAEGLSYDPDSASIKYRAVGDTTSWEEIIGNVITPTKDGQKLTFDIGDGANNTLEGKAVCLTFTTTITNNNEAKAESKVKNTAFLKSTDFTGDGMSSNEASVMIGIQPIKKDQAGYAYDTRTMTWSVTVDTQKQKYLHEGSGSLYVLDLMVHGNSFDAENAVIPQELKDKLNSITTFGLNKLTPAYNQAYIDNSFDKGSSTGLTGEVYQITDGNNNVADLLVVTGISSEEKNQFTYKTLLTDPNIYASNKSTTIKNTAFLYNDGGEINSAPAEAPISSKMLSKSMLHRDAAIAFEDGESTEIGNFTNGLRNGFRYDDKTVIFRILVNENGLKNATNELGAMTVTDTLPVGWEFENFKGKNISYAIFNSAWEEQTTSELLAEGSPTQGNVDEKETMSFAFKAEKLNQTYIILVKAGPTADKSKEIFSNTDPNFVYSAENKVEMVSDKISYTTNPSGSQKVEIPGVLLSKKVDSSKFEELGGAVIWTVEYKPYELKYGGESIEDILPIGLDLPMDANGKLLFAGDNFTVETLAMNPDADGSYTGTKLDENTLAGYIKYEGEDRKLTFTFPEKDQAYRFTYKTFVSADEGVKLNNTVTLCGKTTVESNVKETYYAQEVSASATVQWAGALTINKQATDGTALPGAVFALYDKDEQVIIKRSRSNNNGIAKMRGIVAEGTYILKEIAAPDGYSVSAKKYEVTVVKDSTNKFTTTIGYSGKNDVTIKNYKSDTLGDLKISKTVIGDAADTEKAFDFTIKFKDNNDEFSYRISNGTMGTIQSGGSIELSDGQEVTITGIPEGTEYTVTEDAAGYTATWNGNEGVEALGTIEAKETQMVAFVNAKYKTEGALAISKIVKGNTGDTEKAFSFKIEFQETKKSFPFTTNKGGSGTLSSGDTFTLKHGEVMTITGIPKNEVYTVTEEDYSVDGYITTKTGDTGSIDVNDMQVAAFTNTKDKKGGGGGTTPQPVFGSVTVIKTDRDSTKTLSGAVFQLLDADKNVLKTSSATGSDGEIIFDDLDLGVKYTIKEKTAPNGYEKSDKLYSFILTEEKGERNITIEIENKKTKEEKPKDPEEETPTIVDPNKPPTTGMEIDTPKNPDKDKKDPESLYDIDPNGTPTTGRFDNGVPTTSKELDDTPKTGENTLVKNGIIAVTLISGCGLALLALLKRKRFKA